MNLGIDIHGTLDKYSGIILPLIEILTKSHNNVFIISGSTREKILKELNIIGCKHMIHYHYIVSVPDYLREKGVEFIQVSGVDPRCDDKTWWESKAKICCDYRIDVLIDNEEKYKQYFSNLQTKFILLK